jgi:hypothetical protein
MVVILRGEHAPQCVNFPREGTGEQSGTGFIARLVVTPGEEDTE